MRKILFRGKNEDGKWVEGWFEMYPFGCWPVKAAIIPSEEAIEGHYHHVKVDPKTVGQYTGLLDRNGSKIFENDICQDKKTGKIVCVKWHGTMAGFVWHKRKENSDLFDFGELLRANDKYEVIGNVHDNPELLEV